MTDGDDRAQLTVTLWRHGDEVVGRVRWLASIVTGPETVLEERGLDDLIAAIVTQLREIASDGA